MREIPTSRFNQIISQVDTSFQIPHEAGCPSDPEEEANSFYSSDSYENLDIKLNLKHVPGRSEYIKRLVPQLDLENLPDYQTTDDEAEENNNNNN